MFEELTNRYIFTGKLVAEMPIHIGSGVSSVETDAPVIKDLNENPFIPGSSFKGVFRSSLERIVNQLGLSLKSCCLFDETSDVKCLTVNKELQKDYNAKRERRVPETELLQELNENLCDVCKLFGSPFSASKVKFSDMPILKKQGENTVITSVRDGVGIDRDTGTAVEQVKFDYEVVPWQREFSFEMIAENLSQNDFGLLAIGFREFMSGTARIGGNTSRGLGKCILKIAPIKYLDLCDKDALKAYLIENKMQQIDKPDDFIAEKIKALFPTTK